MPFQPGQSGNPSGRPKESAAVKALAREFTDEAIRTLAEVMREGSHRDRVAAAQALLDRGHGKPTQPVSGDEDSPAIKASLEVTMVSAGRAA